MTLPASARAAAVAFDNPGAQSRMMMSASGAANWPPVVRRSANVTVSLSQYSMRHVRLPSMSLDTVMLEMGAWSPKA